MDFTPSLRFSLRYMNNTVLAYTYTYMRVFFAMYLCSVKAGLLASFEECLVEKYFIVLY